MIWAVILAAGQSKRMGEPKLLLPFGEKTIIETVIESALQSKADEVLVVLGANCDRIEQIIEKLPVRIVFNPRYSEGMLSSVQYGFHAIPKNARAALVILSDQPAVSSTTADTIIDEFKRTRRGIILPVYGGRRGHPVLIDMKYRSEIDNLNPDVGLRELIHNHPEDIMEIELDAPSILQDIDNEDDYKRECKRDREGDQY